MTFLMSLALYMIVGCLFYIALGLSSIVAELKGIEKELKLMRKHRTDC